jgi:transcriptional regulator with XRE-family HTH domain
MQRFGQQLKTFRQKQRLTQLELAQRSAVPQPLISDLEAGKREGVTLEMAWRLARALSVSLDHLAGTWDNTEGAAPALPAGATVPTARGRPRRRPVATPTRPG